VRRVEFAWLQYTENAGSCAQGHQIGRASLATHQGWDAIDLYLVLPNQYYAVLRSTDANANPPIRRRGFFQHFSEPRRVALYGLGVVHFRDEDKGSFIETHMELQFDAGVVPNLNDAATRRFELLHGCTDVSLEQVMAAQP
jgi:hypothetical protein